MSDPFPTVGRIHREAPALDALIPANTIIERLADGFTWSEGPVWIDDQACLLLSDVPANKMYRWSDADGLSIFLDPSGYEGSEAGIFREPGSNGLIRGPGNSILVADHGNRAVAQLDLATRRKAFLATHFEGKRFNSPNDLVLAGDGSIYFTDPPYGLEGLNASPHKELAFNGVYRLRPDGGLSLIDDTLSFPNGIQLSPDGRRLYVSISDPDRPLVIAYGLDDAGDAMESRVFADMRDLARAGLIGLPDGMAVDVAGNLFVTGPGGVNVFSASGERLGRIETGTAVANCTFGGADGTTLYLASDHFLARIRTATTGHRLD